MKTIYYSFSKQKKVYMEHIRKEIRVDGKWLYHHRKGLTLIGRSLGLYLAYIVLERLACGSHIYSIWNCWIGCWSFIPSGCINRKKFMSYRLARYTSRMEGITPGCLVQQIRNINFGGSSIIEAGLLSLKHRPNRPVRKIGHKTQ